MNIKLESPKQAYRRLEQERNELKKRITSLEQSITTITTDVNYEGGVQYWIQRHNSAWEMLTKSEQRITQLEQHVATNDEEFTKLVRRNSELEQRERVLRERLEQISHYVGTEWASGRHTLDVGKILSLCNTQAIPPAKKERESI